MSDPIPPKPLDPSRISEDQPDSKSQTSKQPASQSGADFGEQDTAFPVCPVCGGDLVDIRHKLICSRCHTICETCCEGGRG